MKSMQCNVEFGYQLNICSGTKENQVHLIITSASRLQRPNRTVNTAGGSNAKQLHGAASRASQTNAVPSPYDTQPPAGPFPSAFPTERCLTGIAFSPFVLHALRRLSPRHGVSS
jgi:hypothetical protein